MVGLTNPRQRARHNSTDFADGTPNPRLRSLSPHGILRGTAHRARTRALAKKKSKLPLFLPLLVFLLVFWIGLQGQGGQEEKNRRIVDNRGSSLVDSLQAQQPAAGRLRGRAANPQGDTINKTPGGDIPDETKGNKGMNIEESLGGKGNENDMDERANHKDDDDQQIPPPPLPDEETEPNNQQDTTQQRLEKPESTTIQAVLPTQPAPQDTIEPVKKILTLFLESRNSLDETTKPLPIRTTTADALKRIEFPEVTSCLDIPRRFPVNQFPDNDPFLPWIHDYFVTNDRRAVQFVAGNKRRCETGEGKEVVMAYYQAQISLFQPVPVARIARTNQTEDEPRYRLAAPDEPGLVANETRFQCRFHSKSGKEWITFSHFIFNYEYVNWRKRGNKAMFEEMGSDLAQAELSQLQFSCPIPEELQNSDQSSTTEPPTSFWLDLIPIRTPTRKTSALLTDKHIGPNQGSQEPSLFNASLQFGTQHVLPAPKDAGRWANLPVCLPDSPPKTNAKPHTLVACTWSSASYRRRGDDSISLTDTAARLREWVHFNRLVGMDHVYLYDNSPLPNATNDSPLAKLVQEEFSDFVTHIPWPAQVCNDHKSKAKNPGERNSQLAAEASCLSRYGTLTEWMTFLDVDEYLVPRNDPLDWKPILAQHNEDSILTFRSARGRARMDLMKELASEDAKKICEATQRRFRQKANDPCVEPRSNETFLRVHNCDSYPPPRPNLFVKSQKQIVRPQVVLQHFVHNTTVTRELATYYQDLHPGSKYMRELLIPQTYVDEVTEGFLLHAKTVPPPETMMRSFHCKSGSNSPCPMGYVCPATTPVNQTLQRTNSLIDNQGKFCNCWVDSHVENKVVPLLEALLRKQPPASLKT